MAVAVASAPKIDTIYSEAGHSYGNSMSLKSFGSLNGHGNGYGNGYGNGFGHSLSPYGSGNFDHASGHFDPQHGHELKCAKCSCLPIDCLCVESHQVGPAYCPNPNEVDLPREFETHVQIFVKVPEMQEVEETHYKKELCYEKRCVPVTTSKVVYDEVEHFDLVPVVKMVPKTRPEIHYVVKEEQIEVTVMKLCVEWEDVCVIRKEPRVVTEDCEETVSVPVVKEVKVTRMCEEWTGKYCESEVEKFRTPGNFNLICEDICHLPAESAHHLRKSRRSSRASSVSGGDSPSHHRSATKPKKSHSMTEKDLKAAIAAKGLVPVNK